MVTPIRFEENVAKIQQSNLESTEVEPIPIEIMDLKRRVELKSDPYMSEGSLLGLYNLNRNQLAYNYAIVVLSLKDDPASITNDFQFTFRSTHGNGKIQAGHSKHAQAAAQTTIRTTHSNADYKLFTVDPEYVKSTLPNTSEQQLANVSQNI